MDDKVWVPKEIKQKDVIVFHLPWIRRPVTTRMLRYFFPSFIFSLIMFFLLSRFRAILVQVSVICLLFPFMVTLILNSPRNGKYIEDIFKTKIKYKTKATVLLNEKAVRARREK